MGLAKIKSFYHKLDRGNTHSPKDAKGSRGNIYVLIREVEPGAPVLAPTDLPVDDGGGFDAGFDCRESEPCRRNGTFDGFCSSLFVLLVVVVVVAGV